MFRPSRLVSVAGALLVGGQNTTSPREVWEYKNEPPIYGAKESDLCTGFLHENCLEDCRALHRCQRVRPSVDLSFDAEGYATGDGSALAARVAECEPASALLQDCMRKEHEGETRQMFMNIIIVLVYFGIAYYVYHAAQTRHVNDSVVDEELEEMKSSRTINRVEGEATSGGEALAQLLNGHSFEGNYTIDGTSGLPHESALYSITVESSGRVHGEGEHPEDGLFTLEGHLWRDGSNRMAWREAYDKCVFRGKSYAEALRLEFVGVVQPDTLRIEGAWLLSVDSRGSLQLDKARLVEKTMLDDGEGDSLPDQEVTHRGKKGATKGGEEELMIASSRDLSPNKVGKADQDEEMREV